MLLSICIPTHHGREAFLKEAINSVLSQISREMEGKIEICVSDDASQDNTWDLLQSYATHWEGLFVLHRNTQPLRLGLNLMKVIEISQGEYCWFLSSDDCIAPLGIAKVIQLLESNPGITGISVNRANYDREMEYQVAQDPIQILPDKPDIMHIFSSADEALGNCGLFVSYMSAQIFSRKLWQEVVKESDVQTARYFHTFPTVYILGRMILKQPYWIWFPEKIAQNRTSNESLLADVNHQYYRYHLNSLQDISNAWLALVPKSPQVYRQLMSKTYANWWSPTAIRFVKQLSNHTLCGDWEMLMVYPRLLYFFPRFWRNAFPLLLLPHWVFKAILNGRRIGGHVIRRIR